MGGTIGGALDRAAGSIDNISLALLRNMKSPEEQALMAAHQASYDAQARKLAADADAQEIANANSRDPLGAIAQAVLGGDRAKARNAINGALQFQDSGQAGPVQYSDKLPLIQRDMRAVTLANLTDPKSIEKIMGGVREDAQIADMAGGQVTPQDTLTRNYAAGVTSNRPVGVDGNMRVEYGSGKMATTPIADAMIQRDRAAANQSNAAAGASKAHAGLYDAEAENERNGTPGRTGGRGGAKGAEADKQRRDREAYNQKIINAREMVRASGMTRDELLAKDSTFKPYLNAAMQPLKLDDGQTDDDYGVFSKSFGAPDEATVSRAMQRAMQLDGETNLFGSKKNSQTQIESTIKREFKGIGEIDANEIVARALAGEQPKLTVAAPTPTGITQAKAAGQPKPAIAPPSQADLEATAAKYGMTVEQVKAKLGMK